MSVKVLHRAHRGLMIFAAVFFGSVLVWGTSQMLNAQLYWNQYPVRFTVASPAEVSPGGMLSLEFRLTEPQSPSIPDSPSVTVGFPDVLSVHERTLSVSPPHSEYQKNGCTRITQLADTTTCEFAHLSSTQVATHRLTFKVDPYTTCGQDLVLTYAVGYGIPEGTTQVPQSSYTIRIPVKCTGSEPPLSATANLEVTYAGPAESSPGGLASYTATVRNLGPGPATNVQMLILQPFMGYSSGLGFRGVIESTTTGQCAFTAGVTAGPGVAVDHLVCTFSSLPVGQSRQVHYKVRFPKDVPCGVDFNAGVLRAVTANEHDPHPANNVRAHQTIITNCLQPVRFTFTPPPKEVSVGQAFSVGFRFTQPSASPSPDGPGVTVRFPNGLRFQNDQFSVSPPHAVSTKNTCIPNPNNPDPPGTRNCFFHALDSAQVATYTVTLKVDPTAKCGQEITLDYPMVRMSPGPGLTLPQDGYLSSRIKIKCTGNEAPEPQCDDTDRGFYTGEQGTLRFGFPPLFYGSTGSRREQCAEKTTNGSRSVVSCSGANCYVNEYTCVPDGDNEWIHAGQRIGFGSKQVPCEAGCTNGACKNGTLPPPLPSPPPAAPPPPPSGPPPPGSSGCTDSDGGLVQTVFGSVKVGTRKPVADQCYSRTKQSGKTVYVKKTSCTGSTCIISEGFCSKGAFTSRVLNCPKGCLKGACKP